MGKQRTSSDTPGDFDLYVLAQTWAPQFCCTKSDRCTTVHRAFSANNPKPNPNPNQPNPNPNQVSTAPTRTRTGTLTR